MGKTTKEWFQELEEPYRELALENLDEGYEDEITDSPSRALVCGFVWSKTMQGHRYWESIFDELESRE